MGGSSFSYDLYETRATTRAATNTPTFLHTANVASGKSAAAVHDRLNPFGVKMRESRDSDTHPDSLAIAVFFDVTGSMGSIPVELQKKLTTLMALLIKKGYVAHPQIMFGAIGDANGDIAPLQVGQFESGLEMEDDMSHIFLEGNGGGQFKETYELAHYFCAKHTSIDCFEKRGCKGYLFTMGDEAPYATIRKAQVAKLIGDTLESDLDTAAVFRMVEERYNVFHVIIEQGSYPHDKAIEKMWTDLLGERVLKLEDWNNVAELIASTIGLTEGTVDIDKVATDLTDVGSGASAGVVTTALTPYAATLATSRGTAVGLDGGDVTVQR